MDLVLGQNLGQIRSKVFNKKKKQNRHYQQFSFHILHRGYLLKQKEVVVPEWKFKANLARNDTFEGQQGQIFAQGQRWQKKKKDYFQEFHFSQSVVHGCSNHLNLETKAECRTKNLPYLNLNISRTKNGISKL